MGVILGQSLGPFGCVVDGDLLRGFAAATADDSQAARSGEVAPPAVIVTQIWEAQNAGREHLISAEVQRDAAGGVHGEHDLVLHRSITPGEQLQIWVEGWGARPAGWNSLITLRYVVRDRLGELLAEQWWTTVYLGVGCEPIGRPAPEHSFPEAARARPLGRWTTGIDAGMAERYAQVSGDWSAHHFEVEAARRVGVDRVFLHGLCTLALCARGAAEVCTGGDPTRIRRLAGEQLEVDFFEIDKRRIAFEACAGVSTVATHGRVELA